MGKLGVIIANTGSPAEPTAEAVRVYLGRFLRDPRIRPMNPVLWNLILRTCILPRRSEASAAKYRAIWTDDGSPLAVAMASLARKLQARLSEGAGEAVPVRHAVSYGSPSLPEALADLRREGCERLVVIPLYPQSAHSTTKVVEDGLRRALAEAAWRPQVKWVGDYSGRGDYRDAVAACVREAGFDPARDRLLMAFHAVPMRDIRAGDGYAEAVRASSQGIAERLGAQPGKWAVGFQCRFDKSRKWLSPTTAEVLPGLAAGALADGGRLFVVAPNFSIDCLETLFDIQVELRRRHAELEPSAPADGFRYVPCLNDSDDHVELLAALVSE